MVRLQRQESASLKSLLFVVAVTLVSSQLISAQPETNNQTNVTNSSTISLPTTTNTVLVTPVPEPAQQSNATIHTHVLGQIHQPDITNMVVLRPKLVDGIKTIIDLSWPLNNNTLHWPKNFGFEYLNLIDGERKNDQNQSYYVKSDGFKMAVHTGTHLDAPRHFSQNGWTVDQIPLDRLVDVPVHVIDLSAQVSRNRSYNFQKSDFIDAQTNQPLVSPKSVVLVYTGLSKFYEQGEKAYFGTDTKNISQMQIPGFSKQAAEYMVEMKVYGVGLDAASADSSDRHGSNETYDPVAHSILNSNNIFILENISNRLSEIVAQKDASLRLTIAPLPITGGSGSPVRLIAFTLHDDCPRSYAANSATGFLFSPHLTIIMTTMSVIAGILIFGQRTLI